MTWTKIANIGANYDVPCAPLGNDTITPAPSGVMVYCDRPVDATAFGGFSVTKLSEVSSDNERSRLCDVTLNVKLLGRGEPLTPAKLIAAASPWVSGLTAAKLYGNVRADMFPANATLSADGYNTTTLERMRVDAVTFPSYPDYSQGGRPTYTDVVAQLSMLHRVVQHPRPVTNESGSTVYEFEEWPSMEQADLAPAIISNLGRLYLYVFGVDDAATTT